VFQASSASRAFCAAVSALNGGSGGRSMDGLLVVEVRACLHLGSKRAARAKRYHDIFYENFLMRILPGMLWNVYLMMARIACFTLVVGEKS
jgi:hypothetical protein